MPHYGKKGQNVTKSSSSFGMFLFWLCYFFLYLNLLMSCQMRFIFRGFGKEKNKNHHYFFTSNLFSPVSLTRPPLRSHLPGERCPDLSHDRCVLCRSELHNLPLFKVTDCCIPYSTPQCFFLQDKAHILPRSNTILSHTLYQRIAGKDYKEEN